ncbi:MAG: YhcH/YjgK/YiaL family protein [Chloroflexota bacterium]|jgi:YhcH/YjgK/YiaL family protein
MIIDELSNWAGYAGISPRLATAFRYLEEKSWLQLPEGEYPIEGRDIFARVMRVQSEPIASSPFETHYRYVDIHYLVSGEEAIGWAPLPGMVPCKEYNPEKDVIFFDTPQDYQSFKLKPGQFALFLPNDPHSPARHLDTPGEIRKILVKVKLG